MEIIFLWLMSFNCAQAPPTPRCGPHVASTSTNPIPRQATRHWIRADSDGSLSLFNAFALLVELHPPPVPRPRRRDLLSAPTPTLRSPLTTFSFSQWSRCGCPVGTGARDRWLAHDESTGDGEEDGDGDGDGTGWRKEWSVAASVVGRGVGSSVGDVDRSEDGATVRKTRSQRLSLFSAGCLPAFWLSLLSLCSVFSQNSKC